MVRRPGRRVEPPKASPLAIMIGPALRMLCQLRVALNRLVMATIPRQPFAVAAAQQISEAAGAIPLPRASPVSQ